MTNKIKLNICGNEFTIVTDEDISYTLTLANDVNQKMKSIQNSSNSSVAKSAIITALEFCNDSFKAKSETDNYKNQIKLYFQEAKKLKNDYDRLVSENQTLKDENAALKQEIAELEEKAVEQTQKEEILRPVKDGNNIVMSSGSSDESADDNESEFFVEDTVTKNE